MTVVIPQLQEPLRAVTADTLMQKIEMKYSRLLLERVRINMAIPLETMERAHFTHEVDHITNSLVLGLETYLLKSEHVQHETGSYVVPATWWDHFKSAKLPAWMLKRYPAKYHTRTYTYEKHIHLCPHADVPWPDRKHIQFMEMRNTVPQAAS